MREIINAVCFQIIQHLLPILNRQKKNHDQKCCSEQQCLSFVTYYDYLHSFRVFHRLEKSTWRFNSIAKLFEHGTGLKRTIYKSIPRATNIIPHCIYCDIFTKYYGLTIKLRKKELPWSLF